MPGGRILFNSKTKGYEWLSNFWPSPINIDGIEYPTVEHFYQAQKFTDPEMREYIRTRKDPREAKRIGSRNKKKLRADWDIIKLRVMEKALWAKFTQNQELQEKLLQTKEAELLHLADWGRKKDRFWGVDKNLKGENWLGKIIMKIRDTLGESK